LNLEIYKSIFSSNQFFLSDQNTNYKLHGAKMRVAELDDPALAARFLALGMPFEYTGKSIAMLSSAIRRNDSMEIQSLCDKITFDLDKFVLMQNAAIEQGKDFEHWAVDEKKQLEDVQVEIRKLESALKEAKNEKKFKDKCDIVASKILNLASREDTLQLIQDLESEIADLEDRITSRKDHISSHQHVYNTLFQSISDVESLALSSSEAVISEVVLVSEDQSMSS
jgi:hypothetical protein